MIPILHAGKLIHCGPQQKKIHRKHCPSCGDVRHMRVVWSGQPAQELPVGELVGCPVCGPTSGLWRLLDRRSS